MGPLGRCGPPGGGHGDSCSRRGACPAGCTPHFLFGLAEKKTGRARSKRKERFWSQLCTRGAKLLYGSRREMVPAGLRWLPDGRGGVPQRLGSGFPRRGCSGQQAAKPYLTSSSFRAFRFATRCRVLRGGVSGSEKRNCSMRQPPRNLHRTEPAGQIQYNRVVRRELAEG